MSSNSNINSFDLVKFFLAYVVVAIHCGLSGLSDVAFKLAELAVPIFFVISGFFSYRRVAEDNLSPNIVRLIKLYLLYTLLYLPLTFYGVRDLPFKDAIISILQGVFIMGENYASWPLWYLWALIVGLCIVKLLSKCKVSIEGLSILGFLLVLSARFMDALHPLSTSIIARSDSAMIDWYYKIFLTTRNGLFTAFPYLSLGLLLFKYKGKIRQHTIGLVFLTICSVALYFLRFPFGSNILAFCLVAILLCVELPDSPLFPCLRKMSSLVYFLHMLIVFWMYQISASFWESWIIASLSVSIISIAIILVSRRFPILTHLYH